ncbi:MAG TPA: methyltransferase domain-containing protein [Burkholderiales bacterium]|nr:methyltransferase domain-containing protein [Burkholderiales bacterium]
MNRQFKAAALAAAVLLFALPAAAQQKPYEPQVGQAGKDVIWVPTPDEVVDRMLRMAQVGPNDLVYDLGAGDGKIAIAAAKKFGARSVGIEYNPDMAKYAQGNVEKAGVTGKARIVNGDIFATDFSQATVVTMYLLPGLNMKLRPTLLAMRPGTRIVSHSFTMEDWEADEISSMDGRRAYFWVVPANVNGGWALETGSEKLELAFEQRFQKIEGTVGLGHTQGGLREPRLRGFNISFALVDNNGVRREYTGRITGGKMEGSYRADNGTEGRWTATKK